MSQLIATEIDHPIANQPIEPNTALVVVSDKTGKKTVLKIDLSLVSGDEVFIRGAAQSSGCWVWQDGKLVWKSPCNYK